MGNPGIMDVLKLDQLGIALVVIWVLTQAIRDLVKWQRGRTAPSPPRDPEIHLIHEAAKRAATVAAGEAAADIRRVAAALVSREVCQTRMEAFEQNAALQFHQVNQALQRLERSQETTRQELLQAIARRPTA